MALTWGAGSCSQLLGVDPISLTCTTYVDVCSYIQSLPHLPKNSKTAGRQEGRVFQVS